MSRIKTTVFCLMILFVIIKTAIGQDCKLSGQYCLSHEHCCGGCCRGRICVDTFDLCIVNENPCMKRYCPPGLECHVYQPDCKGCEAVAHCS